MKKRQMVKIYILAGVMSLFLYSIGVLSGLYATRVVKTQADTDIGEIRESVENFRSRLENIQIQQNFFNILNEEQNCVFSKLAMDYMVRELSFFWQKLPYRLEEYETENYGEEFTALKKDYTFLALKAWMIATQNYYNCDTTLIPILYFYSRDCKECIYQGEYLDRLKFEMSKSGKKVIAFAIDVGLNESSIDLIREYYNISTPPGIIINNKVLHGRAYNEKEIQKIIQR